MREGFLPEGFMRVDGSIKNVVSAGLRSAALAALALGCTNPCQDLCLSMAAYAEECGFTVPESEIDACLDEQKAAEDKDVCRDFGEPETLRNEWTCEELGAYWGSGTTTAGTAASRVGAP